MFGINRLKINKIINPLTPLFYLLPALVIIITFKLLPIIYSMYVSFFDWNIAGPQQFVGIQNYIKLMHDPEFQQSLMNTVYYVISVVPSSLIISLFIALLLNQKIAALGIYRSIYFIPVITSLVAISMVWKWLYNPRIGLLNYLLSLLHLPQLQWLEEPTGIFQLAASAIGITIPGWLAGPSVALISIIIMSVWQGLGYNIVIFLAGLQNIPQQYYEAAKIDGADTPRCFWHVTWPLLSPTTFYVLIMTTIVSFQVFIQVYLMTGPPIGGPLGTTKVIVYYLFEKGFDAFQMGYASAIAFVLFMIILSFTIIQRQLIEKRVHY